MRIGVLGTGQLAYLLGVASANSDHSVVPYGPKSIPVLTSTTEPMYGDFSDKPLLKKFLSSIDVLTFETESIPLDLIDFCAQHVQVLPGREALKTAQDRFLEKSLFQNLSIPTNKFFALSTSRDLLKAADIIGFPSIVKTRKDGYDGKGQYVLKDADSLATAWQKLGEVPCIVESLVQFEREVSILAIRDQHGSIEFFPLSENIHRDGILRFSYPLDNAGAIQEKAQGYAKRILEHLDYVGCLAIEFFELNGALFTNEMAPRVHNSGHWTLEGAKASQFSLHLDAVAGTKVDSPVLNNKVVMVNIISKEVPTEALKEIDGICVYDYGKALKPNRKMGHVTIDPSLSSLPIAELIHKVYSVLNEPELAQYVLEHDFTK